MEVKGRTVEEIAKEKLSTLKEMHDKIELNKNRVQEYMANINEIKQDIQEINDVLGGIDKEAALKLITLLRGYSKRTIKAKQMENPIAEVVDIGDEKAWDHLDEAWKIQLDKFYNDMSTISEDLNCFSSMISKDNKEMLRELYAKVYELQRENEHLELMLFLKGETYDHAIRKTKINHQKLPTNRKVAVKAGVE